MLKNIKETINKEVITADTTDNVAELNEGNQLAMNIDDDDTVWEGLEDERKAQAEAAC